MKLTAAQERKLSAMVPSRAAYVRAVIEALPSIKNDYIRNEEAPTTIRIVLSGKRLVSGEYEEITRLLHSLTQEQHLNDAGRRAIELSNAFLANGNKWPAPERPTGRVSFQEYQRRRVKSS